MRIYVTLSSVLFVLSDALFFALFSLSLSLIFYELLTFKILKLLKLLELLKGNCFLVLVDDKLNVNQLLVKAVNRVNLFLIR